MQNELHLLTMFSNADVRARFQSNKRTPFVVLRGQHERALPQQAVSTTQTFVSLWDTTTDFIKAYLRRHDFSYSYKSCQVRRERNEREDVSSKSYLKKAIVISASLNTSYCTNIEIAWKCSKVDHGSESERTDSSRSTKVAILTFRFGFGLDR